jgi:hypothetical protein
MREKLEKFLPHLEKLDMTEEEKYKLLEEMYPLVEALVDMTFEAQEYEDNIDGNTTEKR